MKHIFSYTDVLLKDLDYLFVLKINGGQYTFGQKVTVASCPSNLPVFTPKLHMTHLHMQSFYICVLTHLTATVPEILGVVVAGVNAHTIGVDARQESLVVVDIFLWRGHRQLESLGLTVRANLPTLF